MINKVRRKILVTPAYAGACGVPKFMMVVSIMPLRKQRRNEAKASTNLWRSSAASIYLLGSNAYSAFPYSRIVPPFPEVGDPIG